jgi:hypothetical protein
MPLRRILFLALASLTLALPARATQVVQMDTRDLVHRSSDIVVGSVQSVRPYWNAAHTRILTEVVVDVGEALKGGGSSRITITQLGGELDGMRLAVAGTPVFEPGEQALLFLWTDAKGRRLVNGLAQGKFDIERDAVSGELLVRRNLDGLALLAPKVGARALAQPLAPAATRTRLADFEREIREAVQEDGR